ncbi:dTDP-glucose 4,6-dehydratase [Fusarium proliferatum]|uniref:dTDP-glucose 4,6-dehydratase n=1 Tax=Gibberella intermedia TaxID=948311 RepID=A0A365N1G0_GIBIN|nr:dTDP-glucose 4,6-dehydratase [Fusarium proliferatum]
MAAAGEGDFSRLEAGFAELKVERRRVSLEQVTNRHANDAEQNVANDLDINYNVTADVLPPNLYPSLQSIFPALQYSAYMGNPNNFSSTTAIECFDQSDHNATFHTLNSQSLERLLATINQDNKEDSQDDKHGIKEDKSQSHMTTATQPDRATEIQSQHPNAAVQLPAGFALTPPQEADQTPGATEVSGPTTSQTPQPPTSGRLLVFFVPLTTKKGATFGSQVALESATTQMLFNALGANPEFLPNLLGRPDYWSPRSRWQCNINNELEMSVYMIRRVNLALTAYIISHSTSDTSIHALKQILKVGISHFGMTSHVSNYLTNPFEIAVLLSSLSLEASKFYLARFRRYMWQQVNKVDDHLAGLETSDRGKLTELTKSLQIISQQADSQLLSIDVAIITATGIRDAQAKLQNYLSTPILFRQPAEDAINYVIDSMKKHKMLFLNYKGRKDSTMGLVYNLVTQSDAANNIQLARSMKRDSTSMSAIACLTMIFLPGTFTSSILSAGIFSAREHANGFDTSSLWWLWVILTIPLTGIVLGAWWTYRRRSERRDAVDAFNNIHHKGEIGQIYNIGSSDEISNLEHCHIILNEMSISV